MEDATTDCAAFAEAVVFLSHFKSLKDPRQQGKVTYPLDEILLHAIPHAESSPFRRLGVEANQFRDSKLAVAAPLSVTTFT